MASQAGTAPEKSEITRPGTALTWGLSLVACAYCLWMGGTLIYSAHAFAGLYSTIGVHLPFSSRIVVGFYGVLYPILYGGAAVLVIAKQYFVREKWVNISITMGTVLVADFIANMSINALYGPILDLPEKLSK